MSLGLGSLLRILSLRMDEGANPPRGRSTIEPTANPSPIKYLP